MSTPNAPGAAFQRACVLGSGSWGTALAILLQRGGVDTCLWSASLERDTTLRADRENKRYLPGIRFPDGLRLSADPPTAVQHAQVVISVVPTQYLRNVAERFEEWLPSSIPVVSATKGLEIETLKRPTEILEEVLGSRGLCVLTGPSHAEEVARDLPASVVAASEDPHLARSVQATFRSDGLRVYTSSDALGAELAGALKNVIAIAAGISDGLRLGDNAKAALLTRGMAEMARFGAARSALPETFFGLAGIGDLMTTCYSRHSRNRAVGERIGRGEKLVDILRGMSMVAEGIWTTKALFGPEAELGAVEMPIAAEVHAILFEGKDPRSAVLDLMRREPRDEMRGWGR
jgi:glycerol-3-phosphate dehydrogenase (NAD(P)+)